MATYESASTRRFLLGRVDCIRSAHTEALQWVTAMCQDESGAEESEPDDFQSGKRVTFSLFGVSSNIIPSFRVKYILPVDRATLFVVKIHDIISNALLGTMIVHCST